MSLIACPECGQHMSDCAAACPHCGAPNAAAPSGAPADTPFLQSRTANTAAKGLAAWLLAPWVGKTLFAIAALAFLAYYMSRH